MCLSDCCRSMMWLPERSVRMKRFIFGFQRRVWCPKWTPLSRSWRMVTTAMPCASWSGDVRMLAHTSGFQFVRRLLVVLCLLLTPARGPDPAEAGTEGPRPRGSALPGEPGTVCGRAKSTQVGCSEKSNRHSVRCRNEHDRCRARGPAVHRSSRHPGFPQRPDERSPSCPVRTSVSVMTPPALLLIALLLTGLTPHPAPDPGARTGPDRREAAPSSVTIPRTGVWPLTPARVVAGFAPAPEPWEPAHRGVDLLGFAGQQ